MEIAEAVTAHQGTVTGLATARVTFNRYGHLFPSDDHKAAMDRIAGEFMDYV